METMRLMTQSDFLEYSRIKSIVTDNPTGTIAADSVAYNSSLLAFRINDASATTKGSLLIPLGQMYAGDTVTIEAGIMNISGVKAKLTIDYASGGDIGVVQSQKQGEFEVLRQTWTMPTTASYQAEIGVYTPDIGDFYVRQLSVSVESVRTKSFGSGGSGNLIRSARAYRFVVSDGAVKRDKAYSNNSCTFAWGAKAGGGDELLITHGVPFAKLRGVSLGSPTSANVTCECRTGGESPEGVKVAFLNKSTGNYMASAEVLALPGLEFNVFHSGLDYPYTYEEPDESGVRLAQGSITANGVTVTVSGTRVTLNGTLSSLSGYPIINLSGETLETGPAPQASFKANWKAQRIATVPAGTMHSLSMLNVTGSCTLASDWGLLRIYDGAGAHNNQASAYPNGNLIGNSVPLQNANACCIAIGYVSVVGVTFNNLSFDVAAYIDGERII